MQHPMFTHLPAPAMYDVKPHGSERSIVLAWNHRTGWDHAGTRVHAIGQYSTRPGLLPTYVYPGDVCSVAGSRPAGWSEVTA